jgi:hypothetical protein
LSTFKTGFKTAGHQADWQINRSSVMSPIICAEKQWPMAKKGSSLFSEEWSFIISLLWRQIGAVSRSEGA